MIPAMSHGRDLPSLMCGPIFRRWFVSIRDDDLRVIPGGASGVAIVPGHLSPTRADN
jgi:hypothetical protein